MTTDTIKQPVYSSNLSFQRFKRYRAVFDRCRQLLTVNLPTRSMQLVIQLTDSCPIFSSRLVRRVIVSRSMAPPDRNVHQRITLLVTHYSVSCRFQIANLAFCW